MFEECGMLDRALEEMQKKESKIVSPILPFYVACMWWWLGIFEDDVWIIMFWSCSCQVDKLSFKEQMASVLFKLGRFDESESIYRSLLFMNPDNYKWVTRVLVLHAYVQPYFWATVNGYGFWHLTQLVLLMFGLCYNWPCQNIW